MGFFDHLHKGNKTAIKQKVAIVRKEVVGSTTATRPTASKLPSNDKTTLSRRKGTPQATHNQKGLNAKPPRPTPETAGLATHKNTRKRPRAVEQRLESSSDENDDDDDLFARKRVKTSILPPREDTTRNLLADPAMTDDESLVYVHGAQIASIVGGTKYEPKFKDLSHNLEVHLEYPGCSQRERFELLRPLERDEFDPVEDILQTTALVPTHYLPEGPAENFLDDTNGYHRRMTRAVAQGVGHDFKDALDDYNKSLAVLRSNGTISGHLAKLHHIPLEWVERVLNQTYARTVSLKVNSLKKYENGTDNVYGELLPRFVSKILHETNLKSDKVFVDLGSGVGNVVLQAALEIGCESWGCEMMDNACDLAELQEQEFKARCCLWGLNPGKVHLERGDFLRNIPTGKILQKADVVLVNNQAFTPNLNNELMNLFLDLKEGCQIVSLKSFVPHDHKITSRNFNSPVNLLNVTEKYYFSNCVSWTSAPGTYYVAIKDRRRLREFEKRFS